MTEPGIRSRIPLSWGAKKKKKDQELIKHYFELKKCCVLGEGRSSAAAGNAYTSDVLCSNTIFHVELVHDCWV